jgi:uncharacterized lipoprotein YmbA
VIARIRIILICLTAMIFSGPLVSCAGMQGGGGGSKSLYALDPGRPPTPAPRESLPARLASTGIGREGVLQVRGVNIAPPFDGSSLVYRTPDGTYMKDSYNQWLAPPEELLSGELVNWLSAAASGPFETVVDGRSAAPHRFALETSITSLYGDFQDPHQPKVILNARVYLLDDATGGRSVAFQNHYDVSIPLAQASAEEFVRGCGRAYRQFLEVLSKDLSAFRATAMASDRR